MDEGQKDMNEGQKDMNEEQKDMNEEQKYMDDKKDDIDEGNLDMDKDQKDMDEGEKDMDETQKDMDEGQKEIDEGQKEMDEAQKDMDEGQKEIDEKQKEIEDREENIDEGQKDMDERQKDVDEREKDIDEGQEDMDERQEDMDERQKDVDDGQTSLAVISEEDSPCLVQHEEQGGDAPDGLAEDHTSQRLRTLEQLRQRQQEDQEEMEEANRRREERRRAREEEERRGDEEEQHRQTHEEEERKRVAEGIDKRRASAERRLKNLSISSCEGDESFSHFSPMSPTFKNEVEERMTSENTYTLNERTESLNRSLQKSNSIKKTEPPYPISKIDDRLEQYTHAIETSSKEVKADKQQVLMDLPSPTEPVAAKKNLFEAGEAWSQNPKETPSKDTDGLKVGVADLIHQWVKGNPDGSCKSPSMPAEVKAGDVLSKKNLWENLGDSTSPGRVGKGASGKKYKFVMMAHGKYEKVAVGEDDC
ncbi:hypothetical protein UPYG_G00088720 [Umbra pygmaea]|uniref:Uncharacterized protein n=1 Tax=Umbra pygmaea TaxID=75934 RepID=A0ABD0XFA4_UMBPY